MQEAFRGRKIDGDRESGRGVGWDGEGCVPMMTMTKATGYSLQTQNPKRRIPMISPQKSKVRYYPSMTSNDVYKQAHNTPTQGLGRNTNTWHKPNCKRQHNKHNPTSPNQTNIKTEPPNQNVKSKTDTHTQQKQTPQRKLRDPHPPEKGIIPEVNKLKL